MKDYTTTDRFNEMVKALNALVQALKEFEHESFMEHLAYLRRVGDEQTQLYLDMLEWIERVSKESVGIIRAREETMEASLKTRR